MTSNNWTMRCKIILSIGLLFFIGPGAVGQTASTQATVAPKTSSARIAGDPKNATSVPTAPADPAALAEGKQIFQTRCTACHSVNSQVVGPALGGIADRRDLNWITHFVHSSQTVIKSGDPYANALFDKFNKTVMPDHPDITDAQIKDIVSYIMSETKAQTVDKPPFAIPGAQVPAYVPLSFSHDWGVMSAYLCAVLLLVWSLYLAVRTGEFKKQKP